MIKRNKAGFTLFETLVAIAVVALLVVGIGAGMRAAIKSYKESTFQSNSATLADILNTAISDILRYSEDVETVSGSDESGYTFTFTNKDYNVRDCSFVLCEYDEETGEFTPADTGYLTLHTKDGEKDVYTPLVNIGAYAENLKLRNVSILAYKAVNGYYFDINYEIFDTSDSSGTPRSSSPSYRIRQINADLPDDFNSNKDTEEEDDTKVDADSINIIYDQNTDGSDPVEPPLFTNIFNMKTRTVSQVMYPRKSTTFTTYEADVSRDWYDFKGWNTEADGTGTHYEAGQDVTLTESEINACIDNGGEYVLYAEWQETKFYIVYHTNGGEIKSNAEIPEGYTLSEDKKSLMQEFTHQHPTVTLYSGIDYLKYGNTVTFYSNVRSVPTDTTNKGGINDGKGTDDENYNLSQKKIVSECSVLKWQTAPTEGTEYDKEQTIDDVSELLSDGKSTIDLYAIWGDATLTFPSAKMYTSWSTWSFAGWSTDVHSTLAKGKMPVADDVLTNPESGLEYYAQYDVTVMFYPNGGTLDGSSKTKTMTHRYGTNDIEKPKNSPVKTGYTFEGWFPGGTNENPTGESLKDSEHLIQMADNRITYWRAKWTLTEYTITYELDGGTNNKDNPTSYNINTSDITLKDPTRTGYEFLGWYTDLDDESTKVTAIKKGSIGNRTFYAKWEATEYTITYNLNGGTNSSSNPTSYTIETNTITLQSPTRTGYTFGGWYTSSSFSGTAVTQIPKGSTGNKTFYAKWNIITYTISYTLNGGTNSSSNPTSYTVDTATITLQSPTRTGYTFGGWYTNSSFSGTAVTQIAQGSTGNKAFYAKWTATNYTITYTLNGGTNSSSNPTSYTIESDTIILQNPSKTGYTFTGWTKDSSSITSIPNGSYGNITLVANWTANKYTIKFNGNGSTGGSTASVSCEYDKSATLTANGFTKTAYTFKNWNTKADGSGTDYNNNQSVKNLSSTSGATVILYAQWTPVEYKITYTMNGGTNHSSNPSSYTIETATITLKTPTKTGYTFAGWYKDSKAVTTIEKGSYGDITLTATWTANKYTIKFNGNGSTGGSTASVNCEYDKSATLTANGFTKTGYTFKNWNTKADGSGTGYSNKASVKNLTTTSGGTVTLYAQWTANKYTIKFDGNGSTGGSTASMTNLEYDTSYNLTANGFTKTGYKFTNWNTKSNGKGTSYSDSASVSNLTATSGGTVTLYAQWEKLCKITLKDDNGKWQGKCDFVVKDASGNTIFNETLRYGQNWNSSEYNLPSPLYVEKGGTISASNNSKTEYVKIGGSKWDGSSYSVTKDITLNFKSQSSNCINEGTLISLADGTKVPVETLKGDEVLLVWNLETGKYDTAKMVFIDSDPETEYEVIHVYFDDGTDVEIVSEHGFFDVNLGEYVYFDNNAAQYIGHSFVKQGKGNTWSTVKLKDVVIEKKVTTTYSPVTEGHLCYYVNGMLSMPGGISGLFNIFDVDVNTMRYSIVDKWKDIRTYGLFSYDDFKDVVSEEMFKAFNGKYLKVAMGKGLITWDDIQYLAERYSPLVDDK